MRDRAGFAERDTDRTDLNGFPLSSRSRVAPLSLVEGDPFNPRIRLIRIPFSALMRARFRIGREALTDRHRNELGNARGQPEHAASVIRWDPAYRR